MERRIMIKKHGDPDVMQSDGFELSAPLEGEVQIKHTAIGLNYMDVYQRSGYYPMSLPTPLGLEAAGEIVALGEGVKNLKIGDRVVYGALLGAYATARNAPASRVIKIPSDISDEIAAAALMKGMTVEYLMERTYKVQPGQKVLFFAASGGVGQIAGQWGKHLGAEMIGVTSGPKNCTRALELGYAHALDRNSDDIIERVKEITNGKGVPVVYDSVGKATYEQSLRSLATYGVFVSFGATTGEAPAVAPSVLQHGGSLYFTRPTLANYVAARTDLEHSANRVFEMIQSGKITINIDQKYPLEDIVSAHQQLETGTSTGSTILIP